MGLNNNYKVIKRRDMYRLNSYVNMLRQNPDLKYLFIELTNACNLACRHCGSNCGNSIHMNIDTGILLSALKDIASDFKKHRFMICLTDNSCT